jgi:Uma2 family endonuclease
MPQVERKWATIEDLCREPGKAELVAGRIVREMATGAKPGRTGGRIYRSLDEHCDATGVGAAFPDNVGFTVPMLGSGRESFCPDTAYFAGALPENDMRFISGPPTFAVEVRSENDYGRAPERDMARKRADYFEAGTVVVWDVDPIAETISSYSAGRTEEPVIFRRGDSADAEPAVPGWRVSVDWIFR